MKLPCQPDGVSAERPPAERRSGVHFRIDGLGRGRSCWSTEKVKVHQGPRSFRKTFVSLSFSWFCWPGSSTEDDVNVIQQD